MNPLVQPSSSHPPRRARAFTLTELLVTMAVFTLLIAGVFSAQMMGMRMRRVSETKLSNTANARKVLNNIREEVRTAKTVYVGTGNQSTFTRVAELGQQIGNSIQIYPSTNTNSFIRYYINATDQTLLRLTNGDNAPKVIANNITNRLAFTGEDFRGNVLTSSQNNRTIRMVLEFYQREYVLAKSTNGGMYDYYRVQTRITQRADDKNAK